jgi:DnaA family protein
MRQLPLGVRWRAGSVFGTFVPGANEMAVRELQSRARPAAPPVWLWGPPASGRTHLLQAACAQAGEQGRTAAYFPMREREQFPEGALAGCERLDVVCFDDVELVAGDESRERELFVLFNAMQENEGRLLLAAARAPGAVAWKLPDLGSRMGSCLVIQLHPLDEDGQTRVLRERARSHGLELPQETARYLLRRFPRDLKTLCELLETLDVASLAAQRRLTVPFIKEVIDARASR